MAYETPDSSEKSAYNEGLLQIGRLDSIWRACRTQSTQDDLTGWSLELEAAWRELSRDAEKLGKGNYINVIKKYDDLIWSCFVKRDSILGSDISISSRAVLRRILTEKERILRRIQDEAGKGSKYEDAAEWDFEL